MSGESEQKHEKVICNRHYGRYFMQGHKDDIALADKISYIRAQYLNCNHHFIPALQRWYQKITEDSGRRSFIVLTKYT